MKVLFVDEEERVISSARAELEKQGWKCVHHPNFENANVAIGDEAPDLLVLDLMDGGAEDDSNGLAGNSVFEKLWSHRFCPVIIYSANPELLTDNHSDSPLFTSVRKGRGAHKRLADAAEKLKPAVAAIRTTRTELNSVLNRAFMDLAKAYRGPESRVSFVQDPGPDGFGYLTRRRVAALLDEAGLDNGVLQAWEQYLYPALGDSLLLGDLLQEKDKPNKSPSSYRLVLSPSCDLAAEGKRRPKVDQCLVAKCVNVEDLLEPDVAKKDKIQDRLKDALISGLGNSCIPLPAIPNVFPDMAAQLKSLDLLDLSTDGRNITKGESEFVRIASVDSPFREQIAWSYQQVGCRPGMPVRDSKKWASTLADAIHAKRKK